MRHATHVLFVGTRYTLAACNCSSGHCPTGACVLLGNALLSAVDGACSAVSSWWRMQCCQQLMAHAVLSAVDGACSAAEQIGSAVHWPLDYVRPLQIDNTGCELSFWLAQIFRLLQASFHRFHRNNLLSSEGGSAWYVLQGWQPRVIWIGLGGCVFFTALEEAKKFYAPKQVIEKLGSS